MAIPEFEIPYSKLELQLELLDIGKKFDENSPNKMKEIADEAREFLGERGGERNRKIARYHGISVEQLVNSPNYQILCKEYAEIALHRFIKKVMEKFGITEKQVWALIALTKGLLD